MTEEKFLKILLAMRIDMLLERAGIENGDKSLEEYDAILAELEEDKKRHLEAYVDRMAGLEAARGETLYLEGIRDGIRLMEKISEIREEKP